MAQADGVAQNFETFYRKMLENLKTLSTPNKSPFDLNAALESFACATGREDAHTFADEIPKNPREREKLFQFLDYSQVYAAKVCVFLVIYEIVMGVPANITGAQWMKPLLEEIFKQQTSRLEAVLQTGCLLNIFLNRIIDWVSVLYFLSFLFVKKKERSNI